MDGPTRAGHARPAGHRDAGGGGRRAAEFGGHPTRRSLTAAISAPAPRRRRRAASSRPPARVRPTSPSHDRPVRWLEHPTPAAAPDATPRTARGSSANCPNMGGQRRCGSGDPATTPTTPTVPSADAGHLGSRSPAARLGGPPDPYRVSDGVAAGQRQPVVVRELRCSAGRRSAAVRGSVPRPRRRAGPPAPASRRSAPRSRPRRRAAARAPRLPRSDVTPGERDRRHRPEHRVRRRRVDPEGGAMASRPVEGERVVRRHHLRPAAGHLRAPSSRSPPGATGRPVGSDGPGPVELVSGTASGRP